MTDQTPKNDPDKRVCDACGKVIEGSHFTTLGETKKLYHINCKPQFFFIFDKEIPPYPKRGKQ